MAEQNMVQDVENLGLQEVSEPALTVDSLDEVNDGKAKPEAEQQERAEPGYVKTRIESALKKARAEWQAEMDAKYAPLMELKYERDAQALVDAGTVTDIEVAKELVKLRNGQNATKASTETPRDENGRFSKKAKEPAVEARAEILVAQAEKIRKRTGVDVLNAYNTDESIKEKVLSGEWDFYDVAENIPSSKKVPSPVVASNGGRAAATSVARMTDEQFARLNANLTSGKRYDLRE